MYTTFFGLNTLPFNLTPDPAFLYLSPRHREALAGITYAITERKGFVVLSGDAGTGKTTLVNSALSRLPADRIESSIILNPTLTASEFLESVLLDFDLGEVPASKAQRLWRLQEFLAKAHHQNRVAVLVIDEAHKLSLDVLEEIRLLGNFEGGAHKYLQILLLGQSELDVLLNRQDLRQFRQRIALRLEIQPLTGPEIAEYIAFRWAKAGGRGAPPFTPEAVRAIGEWSQGIPRLVNSLSDTALLIAHSHESQSVGISYVADATLNLGISSTPTEQTAIRPVALVSGEKAHHGRTPGSAEDDFALPTLLHYASPRPTSPLLRRLADRFGIGR